MKFHENLKRICNAKGTSPTAVLREMDVATSKIAAWNKGNLPKEDMMVRLAQHLGCSVMDFFWDESDDLPDFQSAEIKDEVPMNEDEADILNLYRSLDRRQRHAFMALVYDFEKQLERTGDGTGENSSVG